MIQVGLQTVKNELDTDCQCCDQ